MNKSFFAMESDRVQVLVYELLELIENQRKQLTDERYNDHRRKAGDRINFFQKQKVDETQEEFGERLRKDLRKGKSEWWYINYLRGYSDWFTEREDLAKSLIKACQASSVINISVEDYDQICIDKKSSKSL